MGAQRREIENRAGTVVIKKDGTALKDGRFVEGGGSLASSFSTKAKESGPENSNNVVSILKDVVIPRMKSGKPDDALGVVIMFRSASHGTIETPNGDALSQKGIENLIEDTAQLGARRPFLQISSKDAQGLHALALETAHQMQKGMIMDEALGKNFDANWNLGRLLHNLGKPRDALPYIAMSHEIQPENPKVAARLTEISLDLYNEIPSQTNEIRVLMALDAAESLEQSDYMDALGKRVENELNLRKERTPGLHAAL